MKKQSLIKASLVLGIAGIVARFLGYVFRCYGFRSSCSYFKDDFREESKGRYRRHICYTKGIYNTNDVVRNWYNPYIICLCKAYNKVCSMGYEILLCFIRYILCAICNIYYDYIQRILPRASKYDPFRDFTDFRANRKSNHRSWTCYLTFTKRNIICSRRSSFWSSSRGSDRRKLFT